MDLNICYGLICTVYYAPHMAPIWPPYGPNMPPIWSPYAPHMVPIWSPYGPHMPPEKSSSVVYFMSKHEPAWTNRAEAPWAMGCPPQGSPFPPPPSSHGSPWGSHAPPWAPMGQDLRGPRIPMSSLRSASTSQVLQAKSDARGAPAETWISGRTNRRNHCGSFRRRC